MTIEWNTAPSVAEVSALLLGPPPVNVEVDEFVAMLTYANGQVLRVEPRDGFAYSEYTEEGATIAYAIGTPTA